MVDKIAKNERGANELFTYCCTKILLSLGNIDRSHPFDVPHLRFARRRQPFVAFAVFLRVAIIDGVLVIVDFVAQLIAFDFERTIGGRSRGRTPRRLVGRALMR